MVKIWANRLDAGTKTWADVPEDRKAAVCAELQSRVDAGELSAERFAEIVNG